MSRESRGNGRTVQGIRGWLVPIGILVIAGLLIVLVILQLRPEDPAADTDTDSVDGITVVPSDVPDLTQLEYRDPADVQAAGPVDAPVALVVYSDYQCAFCAKWTHSTLPEMMKYAEAGDLRIEWRDINMYGPSSERASSAAHAAGLQGKYWEFHDALYPGGEHLTEAQLTTESLVDIAAELGLDPDRFAADMDSPAVQELVARIAQEGRDLGVTGTPSFLLAGRPLVGAQPTSVFIDAVEAALREAEK
ncbi:DsbA family protein [Microbacterium sp. MYb62]|uniref:DsbA family protein n=1 Tax=Microbacterium sp. MYb62 TaxID=1848690 RepID=UPI000CFCCE64|nr:thioredoxin domain-containing protein [Microbacterium sp. MYb62]PRB14218.1 thioredoxin [Microbacterium sp. MYb62]